MNRSAPFLAAAAIAVAGTGQGHANLIFQHDFENAPNPGTAVGSIADLGIPAVGSVSYSGSPVGGIGGNRRSLAIANNAGSIANMTQMAPNAVSFDANTDPVNNSFPETQVADAGGGDRFLVDFASPGLFTEGGSTSINFNWASFGNQNAGQFKYQFVRGLDATGAEVFELLMQSGSSSATRALYARGADDDSTTLTASNAGTPEGTLLANQFGFGLNGTNVANGRPSGTYLIGITLEDGMVTYDVGASGGSVTSTAANGMAMPINSSATTITQLEFSSVWNATEAGGNKGYWVDDLVVSSIPEPSSAALAMGFAACIAVRRRM